MKTAPACPPGALAAEATQIAIPANPLVARRAADAARKRTARAAASSTAKANCLTTRGAARAAASATTKAAHAARMRATRAATPAEEKAQHASRVRATRAAASSAATQAAHAARRRATRAAAPAEEKAQRLAAARAAYRMAAAAVSTTQRTERNATRRGQRQAARQAALTTAAAEQFARDGPPASQHIREVVSAALQADSGSFITGFSAQIFRFIADCEPGASPRVRSGQVAAVEADIQKHCAVTPDDVERIVANSDRRMDPSRPHDVPIAASRDTIGIETTFLYVNMLAST